MMEEKTSVRILTPLDMWHILRQSWLVVLLAAIAAVGLLFGWSRLGWTPQYESIATLYVLPQNQTGNDFSLALDIIDDCAYLLESHALVEQVVEELALPSSSDELQKAISVTNPGNTRFLEVKVKADTAQLAKNIVDYLCESGTDKIRQTVGGEQVSLYEAGTLAAEPCNMVGLPIYALLGVAGAMVAYCFCLLKYIFGGVNVCNTGAGEERKGEVKA